MTSVALEMVFRLGHSIWEWTEWRWRSERLCELFRWEVNWKYQRIYRPQLMNVTWITRICCFIDLGVYEECEGNHVTELGPGGYRGFVNSILLRDIPSETIFLGTEVTLIDYSSHPIKVTSQRGVEHFDHVICTVPLGVLKVTSVDLPSVMLIKIINYN